MLKVFKEGHVAVVTRGAYEDIYKPLGYKLASDEQSKEPEMVENNVEEEVVENDEVMVIDKQTEEVEEIKEQTEEQVEQVEEQVEQVEEEKVDNEIKQNKRGK